MGRRDVFGAALCVEDGATVAQDADVGGTEVADGDVALGAQTGAAAGGADRRRAVHGQRTGHSIQTDGAGGGGGDVNAGAQRQIRCGLQRNVPGAADDVAVDNQMTTGGFDSKRTTAVQVHNLAIGISHRRWTDHIGAIVERDSSAGHQDHRAVAGADHVLPTAGNLTHCGRGGPSRYTQGHRVNGHGVRFADKSTRTAHAQGQGVHRNFQRVAPRTHTTALAGLHVKPQRGNVHVGVAINDRTTSNQGNTAVCCGDNAQLDVAAGLNPHIATGGDAALAAHVVHR